MTSLQQQLNDAIREQVTKTEERIRFYTEQQYNLLDEFRDRATKDHKSLARYIYFILFAKKIKCITLITILISLVKYLKLNHTWQQ